MKIKDLMQPSALIAEKKWAHKPTTSAGVSESTTLSAHKMIDNQQGWGAVPDNQNVDYLGMRVLMGAGTFLSLVAPLTRQEATSVDDIRHHLETGGTVGSAWMTICIPPEWSDGDLSKPAQVISHEGRNRMWAIQELVSNTPVEVHLFFAGGLRARHIQPEWINQINQQLIPQGHTQPIEGAFFDILIKEGAPGTLKAKITKAYGGDITCAKTERLKRRKNATPHDKRQVNWFQNKHCGGASRVDEIFSEPATQHTWRKLPVGKSMMYDTQFEFDDKNVVIELVGNTGEHTHSLFDFMGIDDLQIRDDAVGYELIFRVNRHTGITGEVGARAGKLLSRVVSAVRGFLTANHWDYVTFTGAGDSRSKLYQAMVQKLANQVNAKFKSRFGFFVIYRDRAVQEDAAGVGLVVPGVNMPAGIHADEIRRQARKLRFDVSSKGVPPVARSDGKF
jgi:hypothetical protein